MSFEQNFAPFASLHEANRYMRWNNAAKRNFDLWLIAYIFKQHKQKVRSHQQ